MEQESRRRTFPPLTAIVTGAVLLVSYAALDDITTGRETDFTLEYAWLLASIGWLLFVAFRVHRRYSHA